MANISDTRKSIPSCSTSKQTCLPQHTSVCTPNSLWPYFQFLFTRFSLADAPPISQNKNSVKGQFFYLSSCKNSVWTHIFNYTDALHSDNFILFTSVKVVVDRRPQNTFSKNNAPCVLLLLMLTRPFLNACCLVRVCFLGFVHSSSSSLVLLRCQKLMFIGSTNFFLPDYQSEPAVYFSPGNGLKYANVNNR